MADPTAPTLTPQQVAQQAADANFYARNLVLQRGVRMRQQIISINVVPATQEIINVPVNNVGLITGFLVKVTGTIRNTNAANVVTLTELGASNLVSNFNFTDLWNNVRINTGGWHLGLINSAKHPLVFGGAYSPNVPVKYGNNWTVQSAPATIAFGTDAAVSFYWYVPVAYSKTDLRGAMYGAILNAQSTLTITLNKNPTALAGSDPTFAVYSNGDAAGGWKAATTVNVTVWQDYIDQLPRTPKNNDGSGGDVILPAQDIQQIYELRQSALNGLVVGQDFGINYTNYKQFQSTCVVFDNGGTLNAGSDVTSWSLAAANTTVLFKFGPNEAALMARQTFAADPPKGVYYFDHRDRPINTVVWGNMNLFMNPSQVNANAALIVGLEDIASITQLQMSASQQTS